ncbi:MAG: guanylate kinase [Desulfovibrionaceae bacterium]|nr:guanylate kinase [Desulfovibrionaceae bacterium]
MVVCAPSGAGKSTLIHRLMAEYPDLGFSVSCTTRPPRPGEVDGVDYRFLDREAFESMREAGEFAEWAEVHGNFYATPKGPVENLLARGRDLVFDVDVQGARRLKSSFPDGLFVFIMPPSRGELARRLGSRGLDSAEAVQRRLANARGEIEAAGEFDYWVFNDDLERAYQVLRAVYLAGLARSAGQADRLKAVLGSWDRSG